MRDDIRSADHEDDAEPAQSAPEEIVVEAEPGNELIENADQSVERAGW